MEDEDGKEWVVDENTVQKETKCPVGMELNLLMEEICEKLFDLGYTDHLGSVEAYSIYLQ